MRARRRPLLVARAEAYVRAVLRGDVAVCRWVRRACERHVADLERAKSPDYPYRFDRARAERACAFAERLPHVKGHWAQPTATGETPRIRLEPFQAFERAMLFGWVEKRSGLRRFRAAYLERPRKNAKSTDAAITGLWFLAMDGEIGAEVYSGATTEKQAWEVFRPARGMAERTPAFLRELGVQVHAKSLTVPTTGGRFEPIIGRPGDGASPSLAIIDEYHEHGDSAQYDAMVTGMGARRQPLVLVITTAGDDLAGPCYALRQRAEKMLAGVVPDERLFASIYTIDEDDDWTTPAALRKANPNYDVSVSAEFLAEQQRIAVHDARAQNVFRTKHLNVWCTARHAWLDMQWWHRAADRSLALEQFRGERCWVAFDLANRLDLVALALVFRRTLEGEPHYFVFARCYAPEASIADPRNRHYQGWAHEGHLVETQGNDCDLDRILADVALLAREYRIDRAGYDPYNSIGLRDGLARLGIAQVEIPQNLYQFSEPMKRLEGLLKSGRLHHAGDPCLAWQMANVVVRPDAQDNLFPRKNRPEDKIDGAVALIMALRLALEGSAPSIYERRGALVVSA